LTQLIPPTRAHASGTPSAARSPDCGATPFRSTVEAFFWTVRTLAARGTPAQPSNGSTLRRPCDPGEVIRALDTLYRRRRIDTAHARVLARWGARQKEPSPQHHPSDSVLFREAIDRLDWPLRVRGIVA
jgi:hypothetical protein